MAEILLIDENYIKDYTFLTDAVDAELIQPAVLLAQDKHIGARLGDALLDKCKADADAGTLTGLYETLVDDYVRKCLTWWTLVDLLPRLYVRWDNAAPQIRTNDETNQIEQVDLNREINAARDNAAYYTKRMVDWLCVNGSSLPEYNSNTAPDRPPTSAEVFNQSGLTVSGGRRDREIPRWTYSNG